MNEIILWALLVLVIVYVLIPIAIFQYTKMYYSAKMKAKMEIINNMEDDDGESN